MVVQKTLRYYLSNSESRRLKINNNVNITSVNYISNILVSFIILLKNFVLKVPISQL